VCDRLLSTASALLLPALLVLLASVAGTPVSAAPPTTATASADTIPTFDHALHRNLPCTSCHDMSRVHGAILVQSVEDCRSCHHTARSGATCVPCHDVSALAGRVFPLKRTFAPSVEAEPSVRTLPFRHEPHENLQCTRCHTDGPDLAIPNLDCTSCHAEHHRTDTSCFDCHRQPRQGAHNLSVHVTCTGSGCHESVPVNGPPRTRTGCLWCHQDQRDHMTGKECVSCHVMPPVRSTAAATP